MSSSHAPVGGPLVGGYGFPVQEEGRGTARRTAWHLLRSSVNLQAGIQGAV